MTVTPEELAAYADGELEGPEAARVLLAVVARPELMRIVPSGWPPCCARRTSRRSGIPGGSRGEQRGVGKMARFLHHAPTGAARMLRLTPGRTLNSQARVASPCHIDAG
jgi:hypothetical protein